MFNLFLIMLAAELIFLLFQFLPREIQLMIWEYALPAPRTIHLCSYIADDRDRTEELYEPWDSRQPESPLRTTCRDSRWIFKRMYVHLYGITNREHNRPLFFSPKVDTLYLDVSSDILYHPVTNKRRNAVLRARDEAQVADNITTPDSTDPPFCDDLPMNAFGFLASQEILKSIRHLAIEYRPWGRFCLEHKSNMISEFFPCFPALETFSFVVGDSMIFRHGGRVKYPLELEYTKQGTLAELCARRVLRIEFAALQVTRRKHPNLKAPKFDVKILKKVTYNSALGMLSTERRNSNVGNRCFEPAAAHQNFESASLR
ncbi:hypothetical protein L207DRAFT_583104 [Hyaloscypha variabilis F]|uniref:2EXR domain-containing protein n=1 Tax=Hyaloscypha variabilis (strain UAMH 11265 / GT02V1 / F) TaxID=1149755 RepID=A0A2J6RR18_HYAVF|nr:hypothetical protein L207DRAFT_583104 [Hyaloscypha variabilis F]